MSRKVGLVVEGVSDKKFFDEHFKKQFPDFRGMKVILSGTDNTCKIQNEKKVKSKIADLRDKDCNEIYVFIDLDSQCKKKTYDCVVELKNDFVTKMNLSCETDVKVIVVSSEIEAWMLSAWGNSDKKKKEDLQKKLSVKSSKNIEEVLLQKFISLKQNINCKHNESLRYFFKKLGVTCN